MNDWRDGVYMFFMVPTIMGFIGFSGLAISGLIEKNKRRPKRKRLSKFRLTVTAIAIPFGIAAICAILIGFVKCVAAICAWLDLVS